MKIFQKHLSLYFGLFCKIKNPQMPLLSATKDQCYDKVLLRESYMRGDNVQLNKLYMIYNSIDLQILAIDRLKQNVIRPDGAYNKNIH